MQIGDVIQGRYRLISELGSGGIGQVWRALDESLGREVALKTLKDGASPDLRNRFEREAVAAGRLQHNGSAAVYDIGSLDSGEVFITFEIAPGKPLATLRGQQLPIAEVLHIGKQLCDVLIAAHDLGVTHRDLKPENIVLARSGDLKVIDFGIAKLADNNGDVTKTGEILGTPQYMSPEQLRGQNVGPPTDQYALGIILFELLEGVVPFRGESFLEIAMAQINQAPSPITRPDCPPPLRACIERLLQKNPAHRFADLRSVLRALTGDAPPAVRRSPAPPSPTKPARPVGVAIGLFLAVGLAIGAFTLLSGEEPSPTRPTRVSEPVSIVQQPPQPKAAPTVDEPRKAPEPIVLPMGCGRGAGTGPAPDNRSIRYVPDGYSRSSRHRVLLFLTGNEEDPGQFITDSGLIDLAEKHAFVIVAPREATLDALHHDGYPADAFAELLQAQTADLCVDLDRVVVMGQHDRAKPALALSCSPWVGAVIHHARMRYASETPACPNGRVAPELALSPRRSGQLPPDGGRASDCGHNDIRSLDDAEELRRKAHNCEGEPTRVAKRDGVCFEHSCAVPYRSCHIEGGIYWPGTSRSVSKKTLNCEPADTAFPAAEVLDDFLASLPIVPSTSENLAVPAPPDCGSSGVSNSDAVDGVRYLPTTYAHDRRSPVLLYLTGYDEEPGPILGAAGFYDLADELGVVIIAPSLRAMSEVDSDNTIRGITDMVRERTKGLCVDRENVIVVGQTHRAWMAEELSCAPWSRAVVFHGHDRNVEVPVVSCPDKRTLPTLALWPLKAERLRPVGGGQSSCQGDVVVRSLKETNRLLRTKHGCEDGGLVREVKDGRCVQPTCDVPYISCEIDGGQSWPGTRGVSLLASLRCGYKVDSQFPATDVLRDFIRALPESR